MTNSSPLVDWGDWGGFSRAALQRHLRGQQARLSQLLLPDTKLPFSKVWVPMWPVRRTKGTIQAGRDLRRSFARPPAQRVGCEIRPISGLYSGSWKPPGRETAQPLWAVFSTASLFSWWKTFSWYPHPYLSCFDLCPLLLIFPLKSLEPGSIFSVTST